MQLSSSYILLYLRVTAECDLIAQGFRLAGFRIAEYRDIPTLLSGQRQLQPYELAAALAAVQHGGLALAEMAAIPVVLVDLSGDVKAAIRAIRLRAADYLHPTITPDELGQRITRVRQRIIDLMPDTTGQSRQPSLSPEIKAIRKGDMWVPLSPVEWRLFQLLLQKRRRIVAFNDLATIALQKSAHTQGETSLLRLHMSRLRAKLRLHFGNQFNIITLRGQGYMLE